MTKPSGEETALLPPCKGRNSVWPESAHSGNAAGPKLGELCVKWPPNESPKDGFTLVAPHFEVAFVFVKPPVPLQAKSARYNSQITPALTCFVTTRGRYNGWHDRYVTGTLVVTKSAQCCYELVSL